MSVSSLDFVLEQIKKTRKIEGLGITGGEPMKAVDLVEMVLGCDFGRPMLISLKTNGFWGEDYGKAKDFIQEYRDSLSKFLKEGL